MKIFCISDTHSKHYEDTIFYSAPKLFGSDVALHCGDYSMVGDFSETISFCKWFGSLPSKHKLMIAGNHEVGMDNSSKRYPYYIRNPVPKEEYLNLFKEHGITYLEDSEIVIDGVKFYGTPSQPPFCDWAFNHSDAEREFKYSQIPEDVDVLLTHCPPYKILDTLEEGDSVGCKVLKKSLKRLTSLKLHCFGHIHEAFGKKTINGVKFLNCSSVNRNYKVVSSFIEVEITK